MTIHSKELLYKKKASGTRYKAYIITVANYYSSTGGYGGYGGWVLGHAIFDVASLGFTEPIDIETTYADSGNLTANTRSVGNTQYIILNSKLYKVYSYELNTPVLTLLDSTKTWTKVCSGTNAVAYGIANNELYYIDDTSITKCSGSANTNVTDISSDDTSCTIYCIAAGKLCKISGSSISITDSATTWTKVSGGYKSSTASCLGIKGGQLYFITTSVSRLSADTDWVDVAGGGLWCYALKSNGDLYAISTAKKLTKIDSNITKIAGAGYSKSTGGSSNNFYMYAIKNDGKLYNTRYDSSLRKISDLTTWSDIGGNGCITYYDSMWRLGVADNIPYYFTYSEYANALPLTNCIKIYGNAPCGLAICEV